jgi:regulator of sigma E protease
MLTTIFAFILVLGILIFVHELGHFLFAKLFKVRVLKFSLGFGPKLYGKVVGETEYLISAFPLGGYVKMFGENPDEQDVDEDEKRCSFAHKPVFQRFLIILAGPVFNLLFSVIVFFFVYSILGVPKPLDTTRIGKVTEDSPALHAGIKADDIFLAINGKDTKTWKDVLEGVKGSDGEPLQIQVMRGDEKLTFMVTPKISEAKNIFNEVIEKRYMVGIMKANDLVYNPVSFWEALIHAFSQTWFFISMTGMGLWKIVQRVIPATELGGPIMIAQMAGDQMRAGWENLAYFIGLISVNLGMLNLLPIPVLDGGHLVFLTAEAIRSKPLSERVQIMAQQVGIAFLGVLIIFVFYNDIKRVLAQW